MARGATIVVENNFTKGLITEATSMNFPENAVTEGDNVVFTETGKMIRRSGIDYEIDHVTRPTSGITTRPLVYREFLWESVGDVGTTAFMVQQVGDKLLFFEVRETGLSATLKSFSVDLVPRSLTIDLVDLASSPCQFTTGKGFLFVCHPYCEPFYISYDATTDAITTKTIDVEIRDFERLDDGLANDFRPTTLSNLHKYNLLNQGWYFNAYVDNINAVRQVLQAWDDLRPDYPSNSDVWWVYKSPTDAAQFVNGASDRFQIGNTPAPNGHYIYSAWDVNRTTMTGVTGLPSKSAGSNRPSCTAFYAGRVFYGGVSQDGYSDSLYFSQIVESEDQFGKCYQANDPTSETLFDLLDTDGGVISLPYASKIVSLRVIRDALIVLATNGIFVIRGTANGPFKATDYTVEFASTIGVVSDASVVLVDSSILWWNYEGIYMLSPDKVGLVFQVENISKLTIQSVVDSVPPDNRAKVKGAYNKRARIIRWLFNDLLNDTTQTFNRILELNTVSQAFYTHTIDSSTPAKITGIISLPGQVKNTFLSDVRDNTDVIVTTATENVQTQESAFLNNIEVFKYLTTGLISSGNAGLTYSEDMTEHRDWGSIAADGQGYFSSFGLSGFRIRGELLRSFNSSPVAITLRNIENAEVNVKGIWDYGFRETTPQALYQQVRTSDAIRGWARGDYIVRKVRFRGRGRSFQLYFYSEADKPFEINGWATFDTGGTSP